MDHYNKGNIRGAVRRLLRSAQEDGEKPVYNALLAAKLAHEIGMNPRSVKRDAKKAIEADSRTSEEQKQKAYHILEDLEREVPEYVPRNPSSLEKTITSVGILALVGSLFFLAPNITEGAVDSSSILRSSLIGSGLFILGVGLLFFRKKRF